MITGGNIPHELPDVEQDLMVGYQKLEVERNALRRDLSIMTAERDDLAARIALARAKLACIGDPAIPDILKLLERGPT